MYRIVFHYCICTTLLLGTFVYSKPYENHDGHPQIGHENQMVFTIQQQEPSEEHAIIEEEPAIFDISTQVAKFILYFIKKYCKNNEKIAFLQNMLTPKNLEHVFESNTNANANANANIEPSLSYFESSSPRKIIESTKPKSNAMEQQGHSINYNYNYKFATVPNYELKTPTIKTETKHKELMHRIELTTNSIPFSKTKQYQTPKFQFFNEEPREVLFKELPAAAGATIEDPLIGKNNYEYSTHDYEHEKPEIFEPMYEYASHGDDYDYPLPDYDYSYPSQPNNVEQKVDIMPKFGEMEPQTEHSSIIDKWYKYIAPQQSPQGPTKVHVNTYDNEHDGATPSTENKTPGLLDDFYKYINSLKDEQKHMEQTTITANTIQHEREPNVNKPGILQKIYKYLMPEEKQPIGYNQQPQAAEKHWFDDDQPDINARYEEPERPGFEDIYNYKRPDLGQPKPNWFQQERNDNGEPPEAYFIKHEQPDFTKQTDNWFQPDSMPEHYQLNPAEPMPELKEETGAQIHFNHEPHIQQHVFEFEKPKYEAENPELMFKYNNAADLKEPDVSAQSADTWHKYTIPEYEQHTKHAQPVAWEKSYQRTIPGGPTLQYQINPKTTVDHQYSTVTTNYWSSNTENILNGGGSTQIALKNYADDVLRNYTAELDSLDDMKIYYKKIIPAPKYLAFTTNIDKMKDILNGWKSDGNFYDVAYINHVINMMNKLNNDTIHLLDSNSMIHTTSKIEITTLSQVTMGERRNFDVPLAEYLEEPKAKEDFGTLDLILQNVIMTYLQLAKEEQTSQVQDLSLGLLRKIKYIMTKYQNLFDHLKWIDDEINKLTVDHSIPPEILEMGNKMFFNDLDMQQHFNLTHKMNFDINSKVFLTMLNIPITAETKDAFNDLLHNFMKGINELSETEPKFKDVKIFMAEQKLIDTTSLYKRLMQFGVSPAMFLVLEERSEDKIQENRRAFAEVTEIEVPVATTEIEEITTQQPTSTTPKKHIEKHHNIFREFLMNTDE